MKLPPITHVERPDADTVLLDLVLSEGMDVFEGHFPNVPLLPGVVQIDWAVRLAGDYFGTAFVVAPRFQVKFRAMIHPERPLRLTLHYDRLRAKVSFSYQSNGAVMASGVITLPAS